MRRLAALLLALAGCTSTPPTKHVDIKLHLDDVSCASSSDPQTWPLSCGGVAGVFVLDATNGDVIDHACVPYDPIVMPPEMLSDLPALLNANAKLQQLFVEGTSVNVELDVFDGPLRPEVQALLDQPQKECPRAVVNANGTPTYMLPDGTEIIPRYWGIATNQTLSKETASVTVPLRCITPASMGCTMPPMPIALTSYVEDLNSLLSPSNAEATDLKLYAGQVVINALEPMNPDSPLSAAFSLGDLMTLVPGTGVQDPSWTADINTGDPLCVGTLVTHPAAGATYSTASCEGSVDLASSTALAQSYVLDKAQVDQILTALNLTPSFPTSGLVVGRVIDSAGSPAGGAVVTAMSDPAAMIVYFDNVPDPEHVGQSILAKNTTRGNTGSNGFFAVASPLQLDATQFGWPGKHAPCCDFFHADRGLETGKSAGRVGLINDVIMSTVIHLQ